jgi:hypothetical protein
MTTNNNDFWYDENCPCNGCPSEGACMLEKLACEDFLHYAGTGVKRRTSRIPSAALYRKLFAEDADVE